MPTSYFDRTPTIRNEKDMFERLAQRTGKLQPEREDRKVPPALPVAASTLTWLKPVDEGHGNGHMLSGCGRYSVTKTLGGDRKPRYLPFSRLPHPTPLGQAQSTLAGAQALCQSHATAGSSGCTSETR